MSDSIMDWVWDEVREVSASEKLVMLCMADYADKALCRCWASIESITYKTGLNRKTVQATIKRLEDAGLILDTGIRRGTTGRVRVFEIMAPEEKRDIEQKRTRKRNDPKIGNVPKNGTLNDPKIGMMNDPKIGTQNKSGEQTKEQTREGAFAPAPASKDSSTKKKRQTVTAEEMVESMPGITLEMAEDFLATRKAKRSPLTGTAWNTMIRAVQETKADPARALELVVTHGWQAITAQLLRDRGLAGSAGHQSQSPASRPEPEPLTQDEEDFMRLAPDACKFRGLSANGTFPYLGIDWTMDDLRAGIVPGSANHNKGTDK